MAKGGMRGPKKTGKLKLKGDLHSKGGVGHSKTGGSGKKGF